jgi:nucleotide-binding universal stress UspA family protein
MFRRILVPLDGSPISEQVLPIVAHLQEQTGAQLRLIHVLDFTAPIPRDVENPEDWRGCAERDARCYLSQVGAQLAGEERVVDIAIREGGQVGSILTEAHDWQADLILMSTHGRSGINRTWLGSVADAVVREAHLPVLLVRAQEEAPNVFSGFRHILIPLDDAPFSREILGPALRLAQLDRSRVTLLHILHPWIVPLPVLANATGVPEMGSAGVHDQVERAEQHLAEIAFGLDAALPDVTAHVQVGEGPDSMDILNYAGKYGADLIALATRGRAGLRRAVLGSTADEIVRRANVPVLILRPALER